MSTLLRSIYSIVNRRKGLYADAKQDEFVYLLTRKKRNGFYIDIGSGHAKVSNNSYFFVTLGWNGICVETNFKYKDSYNLRPGTIFLNQDALKLDWNFLKEILPNGEFDYLSVDIDESSTTFLESFPMDKFKPNLITIEHDKYIFGDVFQKRQFEILNLLGYFRICKDIYAMQSGKKLKPLPFEDWYLRIDKFLNLSKAKSISNTYPSKALRKLKKMNLINL